MLLNKNHTRIHQIWFYEYINHLPNSDCVMGSVGHEIPSNSLNPVRIELTKNSNKLYPSLCMIKLWYLVKWQQNIIYLY